MAMHYRLVAAGVLAAALCALAGCPRRDAQQRERTAAAAARKAAARTAKAPTTATATASRPATSQATTTATAPATQTAGAKAGLRRVHLFIKGRVQGVGFRAFTRYNALGLKLTGWVKNLRDGRVEAIVEGPAEKVDALLEKVRRGPPRANVTDIQITEGKHTGEFKTFSVTR